MQSLRGKLFQSSRFLIGTELVSVRGGMSERSAVRARDFANELVNCPLIDWISITDNAGGNRRSLRCRNRWIMPTRWAGMSGWCRT